MIPALGTAVCAWCEDPIDPATHPECECGASRYVDVPNTEGWSDCVLSVTVPKKSPPSTNNHPS